MFAPTSQRPTTISAGRKERPARMDAPIVRAATNATASETPRAVTTAKGTLCVRGLVGEDEVEAEAERRDEREADPGCAAPAPVGRLPRRDRDTHEREQDPGHLQHTRPLAGRDPDDERDHGGHGRHRRDDAHRPDRHAAVERADPEAAANPRRRRPRRRRPAREAIPDEDDPCQGRREPEHLLDDEHGQHVQSA